MMISPLLVELTLLILSYLPEIRDRIVLRCVLKSLRSICETASLWLIYGGITLSGQIMICMTWLVSVMF